MPDFSVVIPCHNEEGNISHIYDRVCAQLEDFEIIFIDDGSTDGSLPILEQLAANDERVKYISFTRNFGLDAAFHAGFKYASKQWIIQIDADLQSPPEEIPKLIEKALNGFDIVFAHRQNRRDSLTKRLGSFFQHLIAIHLFKIEFPRGASTFRIVNSQVAKKVISRRTAYPYFLAECMRIGVNYTFVEVAHNARKASRSKFTFLKSLRLTGQLLLGHSLVPLNLFSFITLFAVLAFFLMPQNISLPIVLCLISAGLWVHGCYIARILREGAFHNLYYVRDSNIPIDTQDNLFGVDRPSAVN